MNVDLQADVTRRLKADYELEERGGYLRRGKCPNRHEHSHR